MRRWMLGTADAHELYRRYGFRELQVPGRMMALEGDEAARACCGGFDDETTEAA